MVSTSLRSIDDDDVPSDPDARPLALFDLDGTLTDPADGIIACHRWALEEIGHPFDDDVDTATLIGPPAEEAHALLGVPADKIAESTQLYRERFAIAGWLDDSLYDGVADLLVRLTSAGWVLGVATMKLEPFAIRILDRVGVAAHFAVVVGSDTKRTRTTKREIIQHAVVTLDRPTKGVVMIGDRRHDIEAARSLQMTSIGAAWGFGSLEELIAADAHAIAVAPENVAEILLD
jgi:phosphoglycolate phosphatase